ncbi:unnamed protein product [Prorocentrum cordatum]|uniref:Uncharacterized protein n=1 Tax=Prorocentrum cordatum TaxID=2364126 RepID=A0ABN9VDS3_9DINO|nr:unnamed protein product [Polarella glacialis]
MVSILERKSKERLDPVTTAVESIQQQVDTMDTRIAKLESNGAPQTVNTEVWDHIQKLEVEVYQLKADGRQGVVCILFARSGPSWARGRSKGTLRQNRSSLRR